MLQMAVIDRHEGVEEITPIALMKRWGSIRKE